MPSALPVVLLNSVCHAVFGGIFLHCTLMRVCDLGTRFFWPILSAFGLRVEYHLANRLRIAILVADSRIRGCYGLYQ